MSKPASARPTKGLTAAILPVTPFQQNCMLVWDIETKVGAVVDPGGDIERIEAGIAKTGIRIEKIILTHGHVDHAGGAADLKEKLKVPVEGPHEADRFLLDDLAKTARGFGMDARPVTPDRWLAEGDKVTISGHVFEILHCPGHSPGSVVLFNATQRFAIVGDVLFRGSIGRTDQPYGDHDALVSAVRTKLFPLGDDVVFLCGHGPGGTFGEERRSNPFVGDGQG